MPLLLSTLGCCVGFYLRHDSPAILLINLGFALLR